MTTPLERLLEAERQLPALIDERDAWSSLRVDYHPPFVDRVWRPWGEWRVHLHRIHPCSPAVALLHMHPWPSAVRIVSGSYEMGIAYGPGPAAPPLAARTVLAPGSTYELDDPQAWHYVAPIGQPSLSLMVTGPTWGPGSHRSTHPLSPLEPPERDELLALFRAHHAARRAG